MRAPVRPICSRISSGVKGPKAASGSAGSTALPIAMPAPAAARALPPHLWTALAGLRHGLPGAGQRAVGVDAAAGILDHGRLEAELARVDRAPGDAEIGRQPGQEHALEAALLQIGAQPRLRLVGLEERRVAVDLA